MAGASQPSLAELTAPVPDGFPSGTLFNVEGGVSFDIKVLADFQKKIYNGFDTENEVEPGMWEEILRIINEATVEGISQSRAGYNEKDADFYSALRHSNEVFSTFKVHTFGVQMASKLFDEAGNLRSFDEWIKATIGISSHQVGSWLETEYNTAILRAHQAADWREFERNRDIFPNLRWMMTTSPDPEDTHKHYWMTGLTLPIDDPFWSKHYPGDRWNCKCSLESTDGPVVRPADIPEEKTIPGLDLNAGKTGCTFTCSHPYFPKDCSHCFAKRTVNGSAALSNLAVNGINAFQRLFYNADNKGDCNKCAKALMWQEHNKQLSREEILKIREEKKAKKKQAKELKKNEPEVWTEVEDTNGLVRLSSKHGEKERQENIAVATYLSKKYGYRIDLIANPQGIPTPDSINHSLGYSQEYKVNRVASISSIKHLVDKANTQSHHLVLRIDSKISDDEIANALNDRISSKGNAIKEVMIIRNDKDATYSAEEIMKNGFKIKPTDYK